MRKKECVPRVSDVLGLALILSMLLYFFALWLSSDFDQSVLSVFLKCLLSIPVFLVPTAFAFFFYKRFRMPMPVISHALGYNESAMLTVSTFGSIVLMQVLYSSVFPTSVSSFGIAQMEGVLGFVLLFFSSVMMPAVLEELFFRGTILRGLTAYRVLLAILISSVSFALMRFSLVEFPLYFFCGFMIGALYCATGSLMAVIGVHLTVKAVWFLAETVEVYAPEHYSLFMRVLVASCVLLFAFGLPFLKKTVRAILADEHDELALRALPFWGAPIIIFLALAIAIQLIGGSI